ncbi:MAG: hypothetical protein ABFS42_06005 [Candidatus Krumholzibacteriota bacterium]
MSEKADLDTGQPIEELRGHTVEPHPALAGRVRRSINRRSLVADSLDLSVNIMLKTVWEYLQTLLESLPGSKNHDKEE